MNLRINLSINKFTYTSIGIRWSSSNINNYISPSSANYSKSQLKTEVINKLSGQSTVKPSTIVPTEPSVKPSTILSGSDVKLSGNSGINSQSISLTNKDSYSQQLMNKFADQAKQILNDYFNNVGSTSSNGDTFSTTLDLHTNITSDYSFLHNIVFYSIIVILLLLLLKLMLYKSGANRSLLLLFLLILILLVVGSVAEEIGPFVIPIYDRETGEFIRFLGLDDFTNMQEAIEANPSEGGVPPH